jgi:Flp pilus assembly protein TadD
MIRLAYFGLLALGFAGFTRAADSSQDILSRAETLIKADDLEGARKLLVAARQSDPDNARVRYQLGYVLFRARRLDLAKAEFKAVVILAPPALYSRYYLGRIALLEAQPKEAVDWLEPVAHAESPVLDCLAQLAKAYFESGRLEEALAAFQQVSRQTPWDGGVHYQLGRIYQRLGQTGMARDEFATSERLKAADRRAIEKLLAFSQHLSKNEREPALQIYRELTSDQQADPDLLVSLGVLLANAGLANEALEPFQAQYNLGLTLLKLGKAPEAEAPLKKAVELQPESFEGHSALALAFVEQGRHSDAIAPLQAAHRLHPTNTRIAGLLASSYLRIGEPDHAVAVLRRAITIDSSDSKLHFLLIEALQEAKDGHGALNAAQEAARRFPDQAQTNLFLAQELVRLGHYQESGPSFEKAAQLDPQNVEAKLGLADVLQKKGDADASLASYRAVLILDSQNVTAEIGVAKDLALLRRFTEAREFLESAISHHPDNAALRFELARVYARLGDSVRSAEQTRIYQQLHAKEPQ